MFFISDNLEVQLLPDRSTLMANISGTVYLSDAAVQRWLGGTIAGTGLSSQHLQVEGVRFVALAPLKDWVLGNLSNERTEVDLFMSAEMLVEAASDSQI